MMDSGRLNGHRPGVGHRCFLGSPAAIVAVTLIVMLSSVGCASVKTPPGTSTVSFFQNPDRVWAAIEMSLDTLEYEIVSSNRFDGKMRAVPLADDDGPSIAYEIDQVAWTSDQVKVYVKPVAADSDSSVDQSDLDKAAADFLAVLKRKLGS